MFAGLIGLYAIYKSAFFLGKPYRGSIGLPSVIALFFAELLLLCLLFMGGSGVVLFTKIIGYLVLPTLIMLVLTNFGTFLLAKLDTQFKDRSSGYRFMISTAVGLSLFLFILSIFVGTYLFTFWSVGIVLAAFAMFAYKEIGASCKSFWHTQISLGETAFSSYTLLSEFFFIILALLLSANFINIVRPMPIGWDDL